MARMDEKPSTFTLTCCRCWRRFEVRGKVADDLKSFYDSQPNHTPDKEVGICDECWPNCQKPDQQSRLDENPYRAPQNKERYKKRQFRILFCLGLAGGVGAGALAADAGIDALDFFNVPWPALVYWAIVLAISSATAYCMLKNFERMESQTH
jgi:hypothetical protein